MNNIMKRFLLILLITLVIGNSIFPVAFAVSKKEIQSTPSGILLSELETNIDIFSKDYIGKSVPGASVVIVKEGEIIFSKGYGYSDIENQIPVNSETTIMEWGSVTKLFTWTALMQLAEQGAIDLDENIKKYLPEDFNKEIKYEQEITVRDLMNHSAGFGEYAFDLIVDTPDEVLSLEEGLLLSHPAQYYEVGKGSSYSNHGTALAGYIIENISGMSYDKYLKENFYKPLDMQKTSASPSYDVPDDMKKNKASGYVKKGESSFDETFWSYVHLGPAGSLNGTAEDLAQFAIGLMPIDDTVSPLFRQNDTIDSLLTPSYLQTANGFFIFNGEEESFGHGGNTAGFTAQFAIVPEEDFGVVVLTNVAGELEYALGLQEKLIGKKSFNFALSDESLPDAMDVEGQYIPLRRTVGSFLDATTFLSPSKITKSAENEISFEFAGYKGDYIQTAPYYYEVKNNTTPLYNGIFPVLDFDVQNGKVTHINVGHGFDMVPIPVDRSLPIQLISLGVIIWGLLFFILRIITKTISYIVRYKKKTTGEKKKYVAVTSALGLGLISNNVICLIRFISNSFRSFNEMSVHIYLNYIAFAMMIVLLLKMRQKNIFKKSSTVEKLLLVMDYSALISIFIILWHWNFFVLY